MSLHTGAAYDVRTYALIGNVVKITEKSDSFDVYVDQNLSSNGFDIQRVLSEYNKIPYANMYQPKYSGNYLPPITNVIFNGPATVVFFADGDKIVVKCTGTDYFNPYVGVCMAITKKAYQNQSANYMIKHLVEKYYDEPRNQITDAIIRGIRASLDLYND